MNTQPVSQIQDHLFELGFALSYRDDHGVWVFVRRDALDQVQECVGVDADGTLIDPYEYHRQGRSDFRSENLDGAARNWAKTLHEWNYWWPAVKNGILDTLSPRRGSGFSHDVVDIFVEARRASPYFSGKVATVTWIIVIPLLTYLIWYRFWG